MTTAELATVVRESIPFALRRHSKIDAATKTFQALRIYVNDEVNELRRALVHAEQALTPGGCLAVISFHSIEARTVKQFLSYCSSHGRCRCSSSSHCGTHIYG